MNMSGINKAIQVATLVSIVLILGHVFAAGLFAMPSGPQGSMIPCPFMNGSASLCNMNALDHLANWQLLFTTLPCSRTTSLLLIGLFVLLFFAKSFAVEENNLSSSQPLRPHERQKEPLNFLTEVFSQGILHPRLYKV
jgi:hypothetical protein